MAAWEKNQESEGHTNQERGGEGGSAVRRVETVPEVWMRGTGMLGVWA